MLLDGDKGTEQPTDVEYDCPREEGHPCNTLI